MTVEEAYQSYGVKKYIASEGDNIAFIVRKIYNSDSDQYLRILEVLNPRVNWISVPGGTQIEYLDPTAITETLY